MKRGGPSTGLRQAQSGSSGHGFDAVIGNPPYLKLTANLLPTNISKYYEKNYSTLSGGSSKNLFQIFIEKVLSLKPKSFSFIVPEALLTSASNHKLRDMMIQKMSLGKIAIFDSFVFENAVIGTTIFVLTSDKKDNCIVEKLLPNGYCEDIKNLAIDECKDIWPASAKKEYYAVCAKINADSVLLKDLVIMYKGMVVENRKEHLREKPKSKDVPFLLGNSMGRYHLSYKYFTEHGELNIIGGTRDITKHFHIPRLLIRRTGDALCAVLSTQKELIESTLYIAVADEINLKYLLGVFNSKLLTFYLRQRLVTNKQGYPQILMWQLEQLPIRVSGKINEKQRHDQMVALVDQMLSVHKQLPSTKTPHEKEALQRQIDATDQQIDRLVYELYGLTEEEIKVVEGE